MRNLIIAGDPNAQAAGTEVFEGAGNAVDAVLAAVLVGACNVGPAGLLGSAVILVAGVGMGQWMVDGRARAPGLDGRRGNTPEHPPESWRAAVPGLPTGVLVAHNRWGSAPMGTIIRAATTAVHATSDTPAVNARLDFLEELHNHGIRALERVGVWQCVHERLGPVAQGPFTRADMRPFTADVIPLEAHGTDDDERLEAPVEPVSKRNPTPPVERFPVDAAMAADMHGALAVGFWVRAPEALSVGEKTGLSLAGLSNAPRKNVTRLRPGSPLAMSLPGTIFRHEGRAWAGLALTGEGALERARDRWIREKFVAREALLDDLAPEAAAPEAAWARGALLWMVRDGDHVRAHTETVGDAGGLRG